MIASTARALSALRLRRSNVSAPSRSSRAVAPGVQTRAVRVFHGHAERWEGAAEVVGGCGLNRLFVGAALGVHGGDRGKRGFALFDQALANVLGEGVQGARRVHGGFGEANRAPGLVGALAGFVVGGVGLDAHAAVIGAVSLAKAHADGANGHVGVSESFGFQVGCAQGLGEGGEECGADALFAPLGGFKNVRHLLRSLCGRRVVGWSRFLGAACRSDKRKHTRNVGLGAFCRT